MQPAPGVLSLIRSYRDGVIKYKTLRNTLSAIEKFHFSFNAITSSRSSGGISGMYSSFGRQIFESADSGRAANVISELIDKLRERRVAETEFDAGFEQVVFTNKHSSQKALVQYVLRRVAIFEGQPFIGETDDLTIEHLLPQSSAKDDSDEFLIGQLGNLILVDQKTNEMLSTNDFSEKREILMSRGYKIPKVLEDTNKLTREVISENTKRISILAREEIWWI